MSSSSIPSSSSSTEDFYFSIPIQKENNTDSDKATIPCTVSPSFWNSVHSFLEHGALKEPKAQEALKNRCVELLQAPLMEQGILSQELASRVMMYIESVPKNQLGQEEGLIFMGPDGELPVDKKKGNLGYIYGDVDHCVLSTPEPTPDTILGVEKEKKSAKKSSDVARLHAAAALGQMLNNIGNLAEKGTLDDVLRFVINMAEIDERTKGHWAKHHSDIRKLQADVASELLSHFASRKPNQALATSEITFLNEAQMEALSSDLVSRELEAIQPFFATDPAGPASMTTDVLEFPYVTESELTKPGKPGKPAKPGKEDCYLPCYFPAENGGRPRISMVPLAASPATSKQPFRVKDQPWHFLVGLQVIGRMLDEPEKHFYHLNSKEREKLAENLIKIGNTFAEFAETKGKGTFLESKSIKNALSQNIISAEEIAQLLASGKVNQLTATFSKADKLLDDVNSFLEKLKDQKFLISTEYNEESKSILEKIYALFDRDPASQVLPAIKQAVSTERRGVAPTDLRRAPLDALYNATSGFGR